MPKLKKYISFVIACLWAINLQAQLVQHTSVLVIGAGTGGTAAGIQSARMGVPTIITNEHTWLGGMLSAAGVTATDGNHNLPSGLWNEFREALYKVYGGPQKMYTGWVSNTQFEPRIADSIFKSMAKAEKNLTIFYNHTFKSVIKKGNKVVGAIFNNQGNSITIYAKQIIDATDLGDVLANAGADFNIGMESSAITNENVGVTETNNIVQDLTYAAILKDYGAGTDYTIAKPANYTPDEFDGACTNYYRNKLLKAPNVDAKKMLDYGKLPNNKYMINWPAFGNDYYVNTISLTPKQRDSALVHAKQQTLRFVYFIQNELGFKNLGLATDEFPTTDNLPLIPYYRESRRVQGLVRFTLPHLAKPFEYNYYKTGISVGDYPIDHHHKKNPAAPQHLDFYPVPSFNIPLGSLIPKKIQGLIVAEKNISVSNVVNGTTRLQPCVLLTGQAAGALAALSIKNNQQPKQVSIRRVQQALLNANTLIMPYIDAGIKHPQFLAIQKVGATGILKGKGVPYKWANQTWFYPDSTITEKEFIEGIQSFNKNFLINPSFSNNNLTTEKACKIIAAIVSNNINKVVKSNAKNIEINMLNDLQEKQLYSVLINRKSLAYLLDKYINPFELQQVNHQGNFLNKQ